MVSIGDFPSSEDERREVKVEGIVRVRLEGEEGGGYDRGCKVTK